MRNDDLMKKVDVLIIGAGAAGMMCAIESAKRGRKTLVIDHAKKLAEKEEHKDDVANTFLHD